MKKFDFSKEFGNIDPKYIEEAEREWSEKKENRRPKGWSKAAAACVIVTLGSVIFSNPHIQAAIKNITLSIGETLGFPKGIESYTEVLNTSKEDKGITVTLKEVVLDNGVLLTKVHAEKTSSGQKDTDDVQDDWTFANTQLDIDYQKTTINGQKIEEYESGHLLPYSDEDLLNTGLDENVYDAVLESRFSLDGDLGENPEVHLVLGAYQNENLGEDYFAEFEFDFSIPHEELMKQTVHKKLEDVSVKTEEGTVKLTDFSMNKLQSIIKAEIPEELEEKLYNGNEMMLMGTDSKGNQIQYELRSNSAADGKTQWSFKTSFWGMYQLDSDGPVLLLPDIDSDYLELQLYTREPYMAAADTVWGDDDFVEIGETTEEVEEVPEDTLEGENPSDAEDQVETQIIGGAAAPTEVRLQDDTDQKENTDAADKTDEDYGTEESAYYDGATGEITAESGWTPVGDFSTVKGKLLFIRQNFLYNPSEKQNRLEEQEQSNMNIGTQILKIRKEKGLTQEEFGKIFHVTRQTVSNWENEKSYPDLQILIDISNRFDISLDVLIKEDVKMVKTMDKERVLGSLKREKSVIDFFTGAGTGIVISCLFSADTMVRTVTIVLGVVMIGIGWYREAKYDKRLFRYMNNEER